MTASRSAPIKDILPSGGATVGYVIDLDVDWNEEDASGPPWTLASSAANPDAITPGRFLMAGRGTAVAVAEVVDRDDDGAIHLRAIPGTVGEEVQLVAPSS